MISRQVLCQALWRLHKLQGSAGRDAYLQVASKHHDTTNLVDPCISVGKIVWLDLLISDLENDKQTVWVTSCLGKQLFCRQNCFDGTSKEDTQIDKSLSTSSCAQNTPVHAGKNPPCFTLGEIHKLRSSLELVSGSQRADKRHSVVKKGIQNPQARKIVTRQTVLLVKIQRLHHRRNAKHVRRLSVHLVGQIYELHGQRTRGPIVHQGNSRGYWSQNSAEFLIAKKKTRNRLCDRALPYRACEVRDNHQTRRAGTTGFQR